METDVQNILDLSSTQVARKQKIDPAYFKPRLIDIRRQIDDARVWAMERMARQQHPWWRKVIDILLTIISLIASLITIAPIAGLAWSRTSS